MASKGRAHKAEILARLSQPNPPPEVIEKINRWLNDGSLEGMDLRGVELSSLDLVEARLKRVNLEKADLHFLLFTGADLAGANLAGANLVRADLGQANLRGADLGGASLARAVLGKVNFAGANLTGANLKGARFVTEERLSQAHAMRFAIMPNGELYDGRFALPGDLQEAATLGIDTGDSRAMQSFYSEVGHDDKHTT